MLLEMQIRRINNITAKGILKYGSKDWVFKKMDTKD
jgi:hypothetical protein